MEFFNQTNVPRDTEKCICYPPGSHSELVLDVLKTLPIHHKLVLYACLSLHDPDKKNIKVTVGGVVFEYQRLATESNISALSITQITDKIKELEMLGFLKCRYLRKGSGRIKYIHIYQPAEIPRHISALQQELGKVKFEEFVR